MSATRWNEIADKAEARIGDCLSAFTLPHWMMALAATGRDEAARRMRDGMRGVRRGRGHGAAYRRRRSRCRSAKRSLAHRQGDHRGALDRMRPVLGDMHRLGGSHAQQDVLMQLYLDCALKADCADDVRLVLDHARRAGFDVTRKAGYAH